MSEFPGSDPISEDSVVLRSIATRLASDGYAIVPGFFPSETAAALLGEGLERWDDGHFEKAAVGRGHDKERRPEIRTDFIHWFEPENLTSSQKLYWNRMEQLRVQINRELMLGLFELEAHFARFASGGFYKAHLDRHRSNPARTLSAVTYLDPDWRTEDGGNLRLFTDRNLGVDGPFLDIFPEPGKLVLFLSGDFWHEVQSGSRPRHSIAGWFRRREEPVPGLLSPPLFRAADWRASCTPFGWISFRNAFAAFDALSLQRIQKDRPDGRSFHAA